LEDAANKIPNGSSVYIGSTAATAEATLKAMVDNYKLANIQIIQMIPGGNLPHLTENVDRFRTCSFYSFTKTGYFQQAEDGTAEGLEDYTPISISGVPRLLEEQKLRVDVAIIKTTKPHKGFVSLGVGVEATMDFIKHAKIVIAEVNEHMPWTDGPSKIPLDWIDWWIPLDKALLTSEELWPEYFNGPHQPQDVTDGIGKNVIKEIPDGATLRFGVSPIAFSVFPFLHQRKELGLHTDVFTESLFRLHEQGVITNAYKTIDRGRTVVSQAHGMSREFYEFLDRNPVIEFHPSSYVCDPQIMAKIDNLMSVVGALKVDLTGQVATDSIAHKFYGGIWSDDDSIRGAKLSKGGKPIVVLPSKSLQGRSNIVFELPPGTGVSITRSDVEYVVTEYGTAYLYGKSIRERCLALIEIAHPDFRHGLLAQAKAKRYISQSQPGRSFGGSGYPAELECLHTTRKNKSVFVRPIKVADEDHLRDFFYKLSDHSVYLRYFRKLKSMPQRILQKTADVDYSTDMALVVLSPPDAVPNDLVAIGHWVSDPRGGLPEIAFQVRDDWQGEGLGTYLFQRLVEIAKKVGLPKFKADVLADNKEMNAVFENSGVPSSRTSDFGVSTYTFDLLEQESEKKMPN
jgi:acyl-CoA hydrolase/GNAT superfamily N-acetyltransferase